MLLEEKKKANRKLERARPNPKKEVAEVVLWASWLAEETFACLHIAEPSNLNHSCGLYTGEALSALI